MKRIVLSFFLLLYSCCVPAQVKQVCKKDNALAVSLYDPLGTSVNHVLLILAPSTGAFLFVNLMTAAIQTDCLCHHWRHCYNFGKNIFVSSYEFDFGNFFDLHLIPGPIYHHLNDQLASFCGPDTVLYKQNIRVGVSADLHTSYHLTEKISAGPAIHFRKFSNTAALWSAGIEVNYVFKNWLR